MNGPSPRVKILPGWQSSGPLHWQSLWEQQYGYARVEQRDWMHPQRDDWSAQLEAVVANSHAPLVLVAHSLGCILTAWWAAHSRHVARVRGALLVAPGDVQRPDLAAQITGWAPIAMQRLPFPSILVGSQNDPYCSAERARALADTWGARWVDLGARGHINAESGLGAWPEGHALLAELLKVD